MGRRTCGCRVPRATCLAPFIYQASTSIPSPLPLLPCHVAFPLSVGAHVVDGCVVTIT